jgi:hypothetical protein
VAWEGTPAGEAGGRRKEQRTAGALLGFEVVRRAIGGRDAEALVGFYADDAQIRTVDKNAHPEFPSGLARRGGDRRRVPPGRP